MKSARAKNFIREIIRNKGRFLSIFFIVLIGTAFFAGLRSTSGAMKYLADKYYHEKALMDIRVLSTLGITQKDLDDLEADPEVGTAEGGHTADVLVRKDQELKVIKVIAETEQTNRPDLISGRMPETKEECLADFALVKELGFGVGDTITVESGTEDDIADTLNVTTFTVTGIGGLPYYIDLTRGVSSIGEGKVEGFIVVSPEVFEQDVFTEGYLKLKGTEGLGAFEDAYQEAVEASEDRIGEILEACGERRYHEVISDAREEIESHKKEIADGEQELADAKQELDDGERELADAKKELEDGARELADAKKELDEGGRELADAKKELDDGECELSDAKRELDRGERELADAKRQVDAGERELADAKKELDQGEKELADAKKELDAGKRELDAAREEISEGKAKIAGAEEQLSESEAELAEGRKEYNSGKEQLDAGEKELAAAWQQYNAGQKELAEQEKTVRAGRTELDAGFAQYEENYAAYTAQKTAYEAGEAQYAAGMAALSQDPSNAGLQAQMEALRAQLDAAAPQIEAAGAQLAAAKELLDQKNTELTAAEALIDKAKAEAAAGYETLSAKQAEFDASKAQLAEAEKTLKAGQAALDKGKKELAARKKELEAGEKEVLAGLSEWKAGRREYETGLAEWKSGRAEYEEGLAKWQDGKNAYAEGLAKWESGRKEYEDGLAKWESGKQEYEDGLAKWQDGKKEYEKGLKEWQDGRKEYEDGLAEWEDGLREYNDKAPDAVAEIEDGKQKLADAEKELEELELPDTYVLDREKVTSLVSYDGDADRLDRLGDVFPVIFFLVAALVSLTAMTRMVEEQRLEIGTMKALGSGDGAIAFKYILYAAIASVGGGIVGVFVGESIIPYVVVDAYHSLYTGVPVGFYPFDPFWAVLAVLLATGCTVGATILACRHVLADRPAVLMRPEAPKNGSRVVFEHFTHFWHRLNFSKKATIRNLFRYKKRLFMTVIGIGGCMALMLVGFGIQDSIKGIALMQYTEIFRQDATVSVNEKAEDEEIRELKDTIEHYDGMTETVDIDLIMVTLNANDVDRSAYLYIPKNIDEAADYVRLKDRRTDVYYSIPEEGALITEKTADMLGVGIGDTVEIRLADDSEPASVTVSNIVENYVMHYLYLSPKTYEELFGEKPDFNEILLKFENAGDEAYETKLGETLTASDACSSVEFTTDLKGRIEDMLDSLNMVMWVLILFSAVLAFVVLYNLNSINMTERKRELATLKVLGFHDIEVAMYIYRENIILTAFGIVAGIFLGILLHRFIITTVEVDLMMFGRVISPASFVICAVLTALFSIGVNLIMFWHFRKIDMIESLKSVE